MTKLIQLNTWQSALGSVLENFIKDQHADILMLQEVLSSPHGQTLYFDKLQNIQKKSELEHIFFSSLLAHDFQNLKTYYGNAILSKFPFLESYKEFTHLNYNDNWNPEKDSDEMKLFQHAVVNIS